MLLDFLGSRDLKEPQEEKGYSDRGDGSQSTC